MASSKLGLPDALGPMMKARSNSGTSTSVKLRQLVSFKRVMITNASALAGEWYLYFQ